MTFEKLMFHNRVLVCFLCFRSSLVSDISRRVHSFESSPSPLLFFAGWCFPLQLSIPLPYVCVCFSLAALLNCLFAFFATVIFDHASYTLIMVSLPSTFICMYVRFISKMFLFLLPAPFYSTTQRSASGFSCSYYVFFSLKWRSHYIALLLLVIHSILFSIPISSFSTLTFAHVSHRQTGPILQMIHILLGFPFFCRRSLFTHIISST